MTMVNVRNQQNVKYLSQLIAAFALFWLPVIVFSKLADSISEHEPIAFDLPLLHWIHAQSTHFYDQFYLLITTLGNAEIIAAVALVIVAQLYINNRYRDALIIAASIGGAAAANIILKLIFHRNRPTFWHSAITETGYSFPSGHAMISSALVLALIYVSWCTPYKWLVTALGILFVALVGISRLYLGVHYPSDIVAGWCASGVWVMLVVRISRNVFKTSS